MTAPGPMPAAGDKPLTPPENMAFHLVAVHRNAAALGNDEDTNAKLHNQEHFGPGGLRDHDSHSRHWDADTVEAVLEEAEREDAGDD